MGKIYENVLELIGHTPILHLSKIEKETGAEASIYAKLESFNPGGSVKDRAALNMINEAEAEGLLTRTVDENDRRVQRVTLAERGERLIREMENARSLDARKKTACLSEAEKQQFVELCGRLSAHMERLALDLPEDRLPPEGMRPPQPVPDGPRLPRRPFPPEGRLKS